MQQNPGKARKNSKTRSFKKLMIHICDVRGLRRWCAGQAVDHNSTGACITHTACVHTELHIPRLPEPFLHIILLHPPNAGASSPPLPAPPPRTAPWATTASHASQQAPPPAPSAYPASIHSQVSPFALKFRGIKNPQLLKLVHNDERLMSLFPTPLATCPVPTLRPLQHSRPSGPRAICTLPHALRSAPTVALSCSAMPPSRRHASRRHRWRLRAGFLLRRPPHVPPAKQPRRRGPRALLLLRLSRLGHLPGHLPGRQGCPSLRRRRLAARHRAVFCGDVARRLGPQFGPHFKGAGKAGTGLYCCGCKRGLYSGVCAHGAY